MRKVAGILSMMVVASLALGACASPENNNGEIVGETPVAGLETGTAVVPDTGANTNGAATVAPEVTMDADDDVSETPEPGFGLAQETPQTGNATAAVGTVEATDGMTGTTVTTEPMTDTTGTAIGADDPSLASNLIGHDIEDANGDNLGEVDSLVIERSTGRIAYVLFDPEDEINDGEGLVAVPWDSFDAVDEVGADNDQFVFNKDLEELANAPTLEINDDFDFLPGWDQEVAQHWGTQVATVPDTGTGDGTSGVVRINDVTGLNLEDANGEDIGEVDNMILDLQQGVVKYVIWAAGGFLGLGEELIPVPFTHLTWGNEDDPNALTLNVDATALENAPRFDDGIPDVAEQGWDDEIAQFWNSITPNRDIQ